MADMTPEERAAMGRMLTGKDRMRISRRAMAGLDPTADEQAALDADLPQLEANGERVADMFSPFPAIGEAVKDPSIANVTNAGVKTGTSLMSPAKALGALLMGYGAAGAQDLGLFDMGANAQTVRESRARANAARAEAKAAADKAKTEAASKNREEYDRAVHTAETLRDQELSRNRRFSDTATGQVWDKTGGFAPGLLAFGVGGLSRAATGGGSFMKDYVGPALLGAATGASAANVPLAYNALFTEPDNPERRAYDAYARELPDGHPHKQKWAEYASTLPQSNPVRDVASAELYDPTKATERMIFGGIEGLVGGMMGSDVARIPGRVTEGVAAMPGRVRGARAAAEPSPPAPSGPSGGPPSPGLQAGPGGISGPIPPGPVGGPQGGPPVPQPPAPPTPTPRRPGSGSRSTPYSDQHTAVSRDYIDEILSSGQPVPSAKEMADALRGRFGDAGLNRPRPQALLDKANRTRPFIESREGVTPEAQRRILAELLGSPGFLAVPGAVAASPIAKLLMQYRGEEM